MQKPITSRRFNGDANLLGGRRTLELYVASSSASILATNCTNLALEPIVLLHNSVKYDRLLA